MKAFIHAAKARQTPEGWVHPATGELLNIEAGEEKEIFVLFAEDMETSRQVVCFAVERATLEQLEAGIHRALTVEPVRIRKVA